MLSSKHFSITDVSSAVFEGRRQFASNFETAVLLQHLKAHFTV